MTIKVLSCDRRRRRHRSTLVLLFCRVVQRVILLFAFGTCTLALYLLFPLFLFVCSSRLARPLFHAIHPKYRLNQGQSLAVPPCFPMPPSRPHVHRPAPQLPSTPPPTHALVFWTHVTLTFSMGWEESKWMRKFGLRDQLIYADMIVRERTNEKGLRRHMSIVPFSSSREPNSFRSIKGNRSHSHRLRRCEIASQAVAGRESEKRINY